MDLYLSRGELVILNIATLLWGCWQCAFLVALMAGQMQENVTEQTAIEFDPEKALEQPLALLRSGDDTHRFVGLALLRSILDNKQSLRDDPTIITKCWAAISPRFLDALLRATETEGRSKAEARSMGELAVAIIHVFVVLLPSECRESRKMVGRTPGLVAALLESSSETTTQILQILLTLSSTARGAHELLELDKEALSPFLELSAQQPLVLEILRHAFLAGVTLDDVSHEVISLKLHEAISTLIRSFRSAEATQLFVFLDGLLINVPPWMLYPASWLSSLVPIMHNSTMNARKDAASDTRMSAVVLGATLLRIYREEFSALLFKSSSPTPSLDGKPFVYLYIKLLLVDIRATIPSLLGMHTSSTFPDTCKRLAASYDIIVGFIGYLLKTLDDDVPDAETTTDSVLPPDLLLQLRADIAEAMSSTIEYIRDRYDAGVGVAPGSQAAIESSSQSRQLANEPLNHPWDSADTTSAECHVVAAQVRALGLWLREDENEKLRTEAANIIDVLLSLYASITTDDIRSPVVIALQGILTVPEGVEAFLDKGGWRVLFDDLTSTLAPSSGARDHIIRAIEIVRVLLTVVESEVSSHFRNEWLEAVSVSLVGNMSERAPPMKLELRIGTWQLAVEVLSRAPMTVRRKYVKEARRMIELASGLWDTTEDEESLEGLREVVDGVMELYPDLEK